MANWFKAFRMKQNKRIFKYTALVADPVDSTALDEYADLPAGKNAAKCVGFLDGHHFAEPPPAFFVNPETDTPTTVTGTVPAVYNIAGWHANVVTQSDDAFALAGDGLIKEGDELVIADNLGRVFNVASAALAGGAPANIVAVAKQPSAALNDIIRVEVKRYTRPA